MHPDPDFPSEVQILLSVDCRHVDGQNGNKYGMTLLRTNDFEQYFIWLLREFPVMKSECGLDSSGLC
jgi:hypothetical protein